MLRNTLLCLFTLVTMAGAHSHHHSSSDFEDMVPQYDQMPWHNAFRDWISGYLVARQEWLGVDLNGDKALKVLDYAAGTGVFSQALAPHSRQILAIDTSTQMVASYNTKFRDQNERIRAIVGDLTIETPTITLPDTDFDLVVVGLGFHHFDDPELAMKRLVERLKPGGAFLIVDFKKDENMGGHVHVHGHGQDHGHKPGHGHSPMKMPPGYSELEIVAIMDTAGLVDVGYVDVGMAFRMMQGPDGRGGSFGPTEEGESGGIRRDVFMARGTKQAFMARV